MHSNLSDDLARLRDEELERLSRRPERRHAADLVRRRGRRLPRRPR